MPESESPRRVSDSLPIKVIACPHCQRLTRFFQSRWGSPEWDLFTDLAKVSRSSAEPHPIAKCPHCRKCFWRVEAVTHGYLHPDRMQVCLELFGVERIPATDTPYATDLERALLDGLPRTRHEIWRIHLMAWRRLNDGLRFESPSACTAPAMDKPVRAYIADALLKDMPNRHPLTRLLRIDILRQLGRFVIARKSATTMANGLGIVKNLGEAESLYRNALYQGLIQRQLELVERGDRLPRRFDITQIHKATYHTIAKEAHIRRGEDERIRPGVDASSQLWQRVERTGWTCHNCGRGGRAGEDFTYDGRVVCRHCGWPQ